MKLAVYVTLKSGVLDPQGVAIAQALAGMGFEGVNEVRQGKLIELDLAEEDPVQAEETAVQMCEKLLANTVIETYRIERA